MSPYESLTRGLLKLRIGGRRFVDGRPRNPNASGLIIVVLAVTACFDTLVSFFHVISIADILRPIVGILDGPGMFFAALLDSSFISVPEGNDLLILGLSIGKEWTRVAYYVLLAAGGSISGSLFLFIIGRRGGSSLLKKRISPRSLARMETLFRKYGPVALILPCIMPPPCPYRVFVLSAGAFGIRLPHFILSVSLGRLARYSTWGVLGVHYGETVLQFLESNLVTVWIAVLGVVGLAATVALITYHLRRRATRVSGLQAKDPSAVS